MLRAPCFRTKPSWPLAAVMGILCFSGIPVEAAMTLEVVRGIQYLTADSTLLPLVRQHDLVNVFGVADEAAALSRLRGMIDLTEPVGASGGLEVGVINEDATLAGVLTNALAEAGARMPSADEVVAGRDLVEREMLAKAEIGMRMNQAAERRGEVQRLMRAHGIMEDEPPAFEGDAGGVEETFADAEIAAQWKEGQEWLRRANRRAAEERREQNAKAESEAERKAVEEGRPVPAKPDSRADPTQFPDYLRAKRAWEQQMAVLNHAMARQFEAEMLRKRQATAAVSADHKAFHSLAGPGRGLGRPFPDQRANGKAAEDEETADVQRGSRGSFGIAAEAALFLLALFLTVGLLLKRRAKCALRLRDKP